MPPNACAPLAVSLSCHFCLGSTAQVRLLFNVNRKIKLIRLSKRELASAGICWHLLASAGICWYRTHTSSAMMTVTPVHLAKVEQSEAETGSRKEPSQLSSNQKSLFYFWFENILLLLLPLLCFPWQRLRLPPTRKMLEANLIRLIAD